jgi:DNA polymerase III alpha subunit
MAGVLEHEPGYYPLQTFLEEARRIGVPVLPVCLHRSEVKYTLEYDSDEALSIRMPFTAVKGISPVAAAEIVLERALAPFTALDDATARLALPTDCWEALARAGVFDAFGERRHVLWELRALLQGQQSKAAHSERAGQLRLDVRSIPIAPMLTSLELHELIRWDFETQTMSTGPHPISLQRSYLDKLRVEPIINLRYGKDGDRVRVAGTVISRQRPPTAKGMCFIILEDETGYLPTAIIPEVYDRFERALRAPNLVVEGKLETSGSLSGNNYRSVLIDRLWPLDDVCRRMTRRPLAIGGAAGHPGENPRAASSPARHLAPQRATVGSEAPRDGALESETAPETARIEAAFVR